MSNNKGKRPEKELHGNKARIDSAKEVVSLYATGGAALAPHIQDGAPVANDEDALIARKFSEENKK